MRGRSGGGSILRPLFRLLTGVGVAWLVVVLLLVGDANAYTTPISPEVSAHIGDVRSGLGNALPGSSPLPAQTSGGAPLTQAFNDLPTSGTGSTVAGRIRQQAVQLAGRTGLMPRVGTMLAGRVFPAAGALTLGIGIGTALNHEFFHFNGAGIDPPTAEAANVRNPVWFFGDSSPHAIGNQWGGPGVTVPAYNAWLTFDYFTQSNFNAIPDGPGFWTGPAPHFNAVGHQDTPTGASSGVTVTHTWSADALSILLPGGVPTPDLLPGETNALGAGTYAAPVTYAGDSPTDTAISNELNANPGTYPDLIAWLDHTVAPGTYANPVPGTHTVPSCHGLAGPACVTRLRAAGFNSVTLRTESLASAVLTLPAAAWTSTTVHPDTGPDVIEVPDVIPPEWDTQRFDFNAPIVVTQNPDPLPVTVPALDDGGGGPPPGDPGGGGGGGNDHCDAYWTYINEEAAAYDALRAAGQEANYVPAPFADEALRILSPDQLQQLADECEGTKYGEPQAGETYSHYIARLAALGLIGTVVYLALDHADPAVGPGGVVRVAPGPGGRRNPLAPDLIDELHNPATTQTRRHEIAQTHPTSTVTIYVNPPNADPVTATPNPGAGGWTAPGVRSIDLSPLSQATVCKFPFCIFSWLSGAFGGWSSASASCPDPQLGISRPGASGRDLTIDANLCVFEPAMTVIRPVFIIVCTLGLAWLFASTALGLGGGAARDD